MNQHSKFTVMKSIFFNLSIIPAVSILLLLTGCGIPSVHPLYNKEDLIIHENLTGTWENESGNSSYAVMPVEELRRMTEESSERMVLPNEPVMVENEGQETEITMGDGIVEFLRDLEDEGLGNSYVVQELQNPENIYLAGLIELDNGFYLDFSTIDYDSDPFLFPVHIFMKTTFDEDELKFHMFSQDWLMELISNRQVRISHEMAQFDRFLLTASAEELQKFVVKYGDMEEAIRDTDTYKKISPVAEFILEEIDEE